LLNGKSEVGHLHVHRLETNQDGARFIHYARQDISEGDVDAVIETLRSDYLTQGPLVPQFEAAVAYSCGAKRAVGVNSATSALHIACLALGLGPGDWLWTSPNTFVASANCGLHCGASVDFVDIDPQTLNMSVRALATKLAVAEAQGKVPKVVVPVHFGGLPCDMPEIGRLARLYGFRILEDASHAIGASSQGEPVGRCLHSDIAVFSFHPVKIITCGEGGMAVTNDDELADRMSTLRTHGITRDPHKMTVEPEGPWCYEQHHLGLNYRLNDLEAALGLSQLKRLPSFLERRAHLAGRYDQALGGLPVLTPFSDLNSSSSWHLYAIQLDVYTAKVDRGTAFRQMREAGIGVNVHYIPVHTQPYYRQLGFKPGDFPVAEAYYRHAITLPLHPGMSETDQDRVIDTLRSILS
jgi:UDP-4-amino-4,6-dideoxy-N-acetyl-beta-L-altrosamine transaminase